MSTQENQKVLRQPPPWSGYYQFGKKYLIPYNGYLVFGSNLRGNHGAGAALYAHKAFGAKFGVGKGFTGRSYAIPTKDEYIRSLPISRIKPYVDEFISASGLLDLSSDPQDQEWFYVTPVGTGLAGFTHEEIAPLFQGVCNSWLPDVWRPYLGDFPGIRKEYHDEFRERLRSGDPGDWLQYSRAIVGV